MADIPKKPKLLWNAIIGLYFQAVLNAAGGVLFLYAASSEADHGREAPELSVLGYLSLVIAAVLLAGAVLVTRGVSWIRIPVTLVEIVGVVSGLISLFSGVPTGVINLVLCFLVLVNLFRRDVNDWFDDVRDLKSGSGLFPRPEQP